VLVVEAGKRSGALITANLAADQGRDVFAVPGNIDVPESEGTNDLIKSGAKLVSSGWDVLSEYVGIFPEKIAERIKGEKLPDFQADLPKGFTDAQSKIIVSISKKPLHIDEIISICGITASEALAELTVLELEGAVTQLPGKRFAAHTTFNSSLKREDHF
jgi:DNA processing protein